ncbi:MAG TPA: acetolactate synthase small subunit, partial [Ruminococcaceae bacterium]|nr:acetolactate synthase small subunit [Oscillospiraceae bacterium]
EIANVFHAKILDVEPDSMILELTGDAAAINSFIELANPYGVLQILRTGAMAMEK